MFVWLFAQKEVKKSGNNDLHFLMLDKFFMFFPREKIIFI